MSINRQSSFWGSHSPLGGLAGAGLLIMASARLSWAITVAGSLIFVYGLSSFSYTFLANIIGGKFFPNRGKKSVYSCISCFWGTIYLFLFWLLCPFAAIEVFFLLMLVPLYCANCTVAIQISLLKNTNKTNIDISEYVTQALSQAAVLSVLIIAFSILREPLSYCSLTFPGTYQGMITIMYFNENAFFPIGIFSSSAGALLLLGFITCLYQYTRSNIFPGETK